MTRGIGAIFACHQLWQSAANEIDTAAGVQVFPESTVSALLSMCRTTPSRIIEPLKRLFGTSADVGPDATGIEQRHAAVTVAEAASRVADRVLGDSKLSDVFDGVTEILDKGESKIDGGIGDLIAHLATIVSSGGGAEGAALSTRLRTMGTIMASGQQLAGSGDVLTTLEHAKTVASCTAVLLSSHNAGLALGETTGDFFQR